MLDPDLLLRAYAGGLFPMADADGTLGWYAPDPRAVLPLEDFHVPKTLARLVRQGRFNVTTDGAFEAVMRACAAPAEGREETWISEELVQAYTALHWRGIAHSVEVRDPDGALVGGLYGVALRGAFFGESMFHTARDASKVALVHLVERLQRGGFTLLDVQFRTAHLARFGVVEVPRRAYERQLAWAMTVEADWAGQDRPR